jgi:hypothetical protein
MNSVTHVLGFWHVKENKKHRLKHYYKYMPKTFEMLKDCNIIFFYEDDEILKYVNTIKQTKKFMSIKIKVTDLATYNISNDYLNSCKNQNNKTIKTALHKKQKPTSKEKGLIHYNREYKLSGEISFRKVFTIWTSKVYLIDQIIRSNPFNTNMFSWIDVAISRLNRNKNFFLTLNHLQNKLTHFKGAATYYGTPLEFQAGFMIADKTIWNKIFPLYYKKMMEMKDSNYAYDEEVLLSLVKKENLELFFVITANFPKILRANATNNSINKVQGYSDLITEKKTSTELIKKYLLKNLLYGMLK